MDANLELGLPADARDYSTGAQMLVDLGVRSIRLLTNNPAKVDGLAGFGVESRRVPLPVRSPPDNLRYLAAKRDRLGHKIDNLPPNGAGPAAPVRRRAGVSGAGRPARTTVDAAGLSLAIAATRWHADITDALIERAAAAAVACGIDDPLVLRVAGRGRAAGGRGRAGPQHDAVVCLGAVIRGGTPHFEYVCDAVTAGAHPGGAGRRHPGRQRRTHL